MNLFAYFSNFQIADLGKYWILFRTFYIVKAIDSNFLFELILDDSDPGRGEQLPEIFAVLVYFPLLGREALEAVEELR